MATLMLEGGADIRHVQQMLGHANIASTQIYTRVSLRKLEAVHSSTHPGVENEPRGGASK
jgi:integrase/recombinase XerD